MCTREEFWNDSFYVFFSPPLRALRTIMLFPRFCAKSANRKLLAFLFVHLCCEHSNKMIINIFNLIIGRSARGV